MLTQAENEGVVPYFSALKDKVYKVIFDLVIFLALFHLFKNPPHDKYCAVH